MMSHPWTRRYIQKGGRRTQRAAMMTAASRLGLSVDDYARHIEDDERWCGWHKAWEATASFTPDPSNLVSGVVHYCRDGDNERRRAAYAAQKARAV